MNAAGFKWGAFGAPPRRMQLGRLMMSVEGFESTTSNGRTSAFAALCGENGEISRVRSFWRSVERYPAGAMVCVTDASRSRKVVIVSGWACELRILPDGRRQIFAFHLPGDIVDLNQADCGRRVSIALTRLETVDVEVLLAGDDEVRRNVSAALRQTMLRQDDRLFDHMVRVGRLSARERVLNLLLDLHDRLSAAGLVKESTFRLPVTQEMFADALGLSIVHINRTLQQLRREGLISLRAGTVTLHNRHRLDALACYQPASAVAADLPAGLTPDAGRGASPPQQALSA
jgi:CRP-like cAMP-binding protein